MQPEPRDAVRPSGPLDSSAGRGSVEPRGLLDNRAAKLKRLGLRP